MLLLTTAVRLLENIPQMHRFCIRDILSIECKQALWLGRHSLNASESVNIISNFEFQAYFSISLVHLLIFSLSEAWRWVMCLAMPTSCPQISKSSASFALSIFSISLFHFSDFLNGSSLDLQFSTSSTSTPLGVVHILRNHFWGSRETPPLCNIVIIWAYPPLCNIVIIWAYPPYVIL